MNTPSQAAIDLIINAEIGGGYDPHPTWPGAQSGLTIGIGYDLGYAATGKIQTDWQTLPPGVVTRLMSYAGRKGASAQMLLASARDIVVPLPVAREVFGSIDMPEWSRRVSQAFANTDALHPDCFGALVSLAYNRGLDMGAPSQPQPDRRFEMRQIRDAMAAQDFDAIPGYIRAMKRLWAGQGMDGLLTRREAEAALFEQGLAQMGAVA